MTLMTRARASTAAPLSNPTPKPIPPEIKGGGIAFLSAGGISQSNSVSPLRVEILRAERLFTVDVCGGHRGSGIRLQAHASGSGGRGGGVTQLGLAGPAKLPLDLVFLATSRARDSVGRGSFDHEVLTPSIDPSTDKCLRVV